MNFWDQDHPLSAAADEMFTKLVPPSGVCSTVQGECLRAAAKINYDWFNNGWGCNNWSGAVVFLQEHAEQFAQKRTDAERAEFNKALRAVSKFSHGETVTIGDSRAEALVTTIQAYVVQNNLDNPVLVANEKDMWDLTQLTSSPRW